VILAMSAQFRDDKPEVIGALKVVGGKNTSLSRLVADLPLKPELGAQALCKTESEYTILVGEPHTVARGDRIVGDVSVTVIEAREFMVTVTAVQNGAVTGLDFGTSKVQSGRIELGLKHGWYKVRISFSTSTGGTQSWVSGPAHPTNDGRLNHTLVPLLGQVDQPYWKAEWDSD
jgi:hypothetical protein